MLNPITALAFYTSSVDGQQYLLAGEDTDIKIYNAQSSCLCGQLSIFQAQSIHGIAVPPENVSTRQHRLILVWGGQSVKVVSGDTIEGIVSTQGSDQNSTTTGIAAEARAPDWIFDGRISPFDDGRIVLLTAHNEVIQAQVDLQNSTLVFGGVQSPSRPILYSGNFFWVSQNCVLVAAGTVFGEILVWKCYLGTPPGQNQKCEVLYVFTGHEGSIFGVHISPEIEISTGEKKRLLASCSDDRTIRIWDITEKIEQPTHEGAGEYDVHVSNVRETGFGNNVQAIDHCESVTRCLASAMGHVSRIWQVEFPQDQPLSKPSDIVELYSFGEDATTQKWSLSLKSTAKLTHQSTFANHCGKHIWSHALAYSGDNLLIGTGGADGKIALMGTSPYHSPTVQSDDQGMRMNTTSVEKEAVTWSLADVLQSSEANDTSINTQVPSRAISTPRSTNLKNAKEGFNRYTFISDCQLLAATNSGRLFAGDLEGGLKWTELALPDEIGQIVLSHALLGAWAINPLALVGTASGNIYSYSESGGKSLRLLTKVDGKVADIFCLSDTRNRPTRDSKNGVRNGEDEISATGPLQFLTTILRSTKAVIIQTDTDLSVVKHTEVVLDPGFMVTATAFTQGYLVLGSRKGMITIFKQERDSNYSPIVTFEVHLDEAITSILPLSSQDDQQHNYFLTTCRDGKYRIHEIVTESDEIKAVLLHETLPPFVSSIEGAWLSKNDNGTRNLMLCGFRSHNFIVWNETQRHEAATVDCGGSSRSYAWTPIRDHHDGFRFVFTKAGQMHVFSQTLAPHKALKIGGHGREIKTVSASGRYIATAAEDTVIRIWEYVGDDGSQSKKPYNKDRRLRCVAALEKHATGIQNLEWYNNEYLFSSGGNEEFFVWKINQLSSSDFTGLAVVCEAVFPDRTEIGDARITDFAATCTASDDSGSREFRISMALSNSTLQTYGYSKETGFRLLGRVSYTGACLTQVRHLGASHILTAATDGHLAIYPCTSSASFAENGASISNDVVPVIARLHQNTIKTLDVRQVTSVENGVSSIEYLVITGGDDNALGIMHLSLSLPSSSQENTPGNISIQSKSIIRSAHAAAVTGVAIARITKTGDAFVVSASNDQRVRVWRLVAGWHREAQSGLRAQLVDERYSSIADAGGLEVLDNVDGDGDGDGDGEGEGEGESEKKKFIVVGVGAEVWELGGME